MWGCKPTDPELLALLERSKAAYEKMTPLEKAIMHVEQRKSWVTGEMRFKHPDMTKERADELFLSVCPEYLILQEMQKLKKQVETVSHMAKRIIDVSYKTHGDPEERANMQDIVDYLS